MSVHKTFRIRRFDPGQDARPYWATYRLEAKPKFSVLDGLFAILENQDGTLGFRYSCRAGMCGSCAMRIDGREGLACRVRLEHLGETISIEPLRSLPIIKDLATDMTPFFEQYRKIDPFFVGDSPSFAQQTLEPLRVDPASASRQSANRAIDCISCGACFSACPTVASNPAYLGPAALNRAFALAADERDRESGRAALALGPEGAYSCRSVGNCVSVCPAGVAPLAAIQLLRRGKTASAP
ncbi:MAG: succinate dehydrogenase iron-sulfur subunit [Vulcanimicrobiaceae bacterium]|jgi:succinate dehydrogenase/fumarate reductase iron-sulfur protein